MSEQNNELPDWSFWGFISSAIAAQLCCGLPWLLITLGFSGQWLSQLQALKPYRPIFVTLALGFLLAGFWTWIQRRRKGCPLPKQPR